MVSAGEGPGAGGHVLVTEFRGMAINGLFCADVLRPLDLVPKGSSLDIAPSATYSTGQRRFTTSKVAADWH